MKGFDMRCVLFAVVAVSAWVCLTGTAAAQKDDKTETPSVMMPPQKAERVVVTSTTPLAGKNIDEWIAEIHSKDKSRVENAVRTIPLFGHNLGQRAVPALVAELGKHDGRYYILDASLRVNMAVALGELMSDPKNRDDKQVPKVVTVLIRLLHDNQAIVKYRAAQSLARIGPEARTAIKDLRALLKDTTTWEVRQAAAYALGRVAYDEKIGPPVDLLQDLFNTFRDNPPAKADTSSQVRLSAIQALTYLGRPNLKADQLSLEKALDYVATHDPDHMVQIWGHMGYMRVANSVEQPRLTAIGKMLGDKELTVRIQAAQALGAIGTAAKSQVPLLTAALNDPDGAVTMWSALALANMGKDATAAVPSLKILAKNDQQPEALRAMATRVIDLIENKKDDLKKEEKKK